VEKTMATAREILKKIEDLDKERMFLLQEGEKGQRVMAYIAHEMVSHGANTVGDLPEAERLKIAALLAELMPEAELEARFKDWEARSNEAMQQGLSVLPPVIPN
jgi:F420-dependent methylenetetrahydromethanopterin dehydrogenase